MAIKNIIAKGIGFASDGTIWIPTHGFTIGAPAVVYQWRIEAVGLHVGGGTAANTFIGGSQGGGIFVGGAEQAVAPDL